MAPLIAEVHLHAFLTFALMERRAKNLRPARLNAIGRASGTHSVGGLSGQCRGHEKPRPTGSGPPIPQASSM